MQPFLIEHCLYMYINSFKLQSIHTNMLCMWIGMECAVFVDTALYLQHPVLSLGHIHTNIHILVHVHEHITYTRTIHMCEYAYVYIYIYIYTYIHMYKQT
jgi:hypothetical protein